jgi:hypothetical protein
MQATFHTKCHFPDPDFRGHREISSVSASNVATKRVKVVSDLGKLGNVYCFRLERSIFDVVFSIGPLKDLS